MIVVSVFIIVKVLIAVKGYTLLKSIGAVVIIW
jgi:hypothetical protein